MRISLKWLRDYVAITMPPEELARRITLATVEVEAIERSGDVPGVVVGQAFDVTPVPGSDHLRTARVETGGGSVQVVCGAPNLANGQKIAYAAVGARLKDAKCNEIHTLKPAKIRGVESNGMICSERELGISDEHEGILVLPDDAPLGAPLADVLGDTVLVAGAWAHRADLLAMIGVAREVAALTGQSVCEPPRDYPQQLGPVDEVFSVDIQAPELCSRFVAGVVEGVTLGPSPAWMQERLIAAGQRSINNVVDITNYVMLETGQPLHSYDYDRVHGHALIVRRALPGERLTTLDGIDRVLAPDMLVIADADGPTGLAGVMGGARSEVHGGTVNVLLEGATWNASNIRRTSTLLGLRSEASSRFEKKLPAELAERGVQRALKLLVEVCGGSARSGLVDNYPVPQRPVRVELTQERLQRVLGIDVAPDEAQHTLAALGFVAEYRDGRYAVDVPFWRTDVAIPDDVIEEIIRIIGFERLPATAITGTLPPPLPQPKRDLRERVKDILVAAGAQEVITYSAVSDELLRKVTPEEDLLQLGPLRVVNPMSAEHEFLRTTLRGSLLETVRDNLRLKRPSLSLFETAVTYVPADDRAELPEERETLIGALTGRRRDRWGRAGAGPLDFFDAKGLLEAFDQRLGVGFSYHEAADPLLLPGQTAAVAVAGVPAGVVGRVHPDMLARFDIDEPVYLYEIDLAALLPVMDRVHRAAAVPRFPAVRQDLGIVVDRNLASADIVAQVRRSRLVAAAAVIDEYLGDRVPRGKKGLTFSIAYQSPDRTLTAEEAAHEQRRILAGLQRRFGAEPRT